MPQLLVENFVKSLNFQHFWLIFVAFWTRCRNFCDTFCRFCIQQPLSSLCLQRHFRIIFETAKLHIAVLFIVAKQQFFNQLCSKTTKSAINTTKLTQN